MILTTSIHNYDFYLLRFRGVGRCEVINSSCTGFRALKLTTAGTKVDNPYNGATGGVIWACSKNGFLCPQKGFLLLKIRLVNFANLLILFSVNHIFKTLASHVKG